MKEWYNEIGLKISSNKTQLILLATPNFNNGLRRLEVDGAVKHMEEKVNKNVGVIFDSWLSFEHCIKSLCSWLNGTLSYLNRVKNTLDQKYRIIIMNNNIP